MFMIKDWLSQLVKQKHMKWYATVVTCLETPNDTLARSINQLQQFLPVDNIVPFYWSLFISKIDFNQNGEQERQLKSCRAIYHYCVHMPDSRG